MDWLDDLLPDLRCPVSQQPLRRATDAELGRSTRQHAEGALVTEDGRLLYSIDKGIPVLLPDSGEELAPG
jgi:uncharacterized protein YbaR (Trm112 family)